MTTTRAINESYCTEGTDVDVRYRWRHSVNMFKGKERTLVAVNSQMIEHI